MSRESQSAWAIFRTDPSPLAKIRELKAALPEGPGLHSLYEEARRGTVLGVPVLAVGRNIFISRARLVEKIEGRDGSDGSER